MYRKGTSYSDPTGRELTKPKSNQEKKGSMWPTVRGQAHRTPTQSTDLMFGSHAPSPGPVAPWRLYSASLALGLLSRRPFQQQLQNMTSAATSHAHH